MNHSNFRLYTLHRRKFPCVKTSYRNARASASMTSINHEERAIMSEFTKVEIEDGIATVTLDDGKANALGFTMIEHINKALDEAEAAADVML